MLIYCKFIISDTSMQYNAQQCADYCKKCSFLCHNVKWWIKKI